MKVAVIQMQSDHRKEKNVAKAIYFVEQAIREKAQFILLPEVFVFRGQLLKEKNRSVAEKIPGISTTAFFALAKQHKVYVLMGSVYEKSSIKNKIYNTSVLINPQGRLLAKYRKRHLFRATMNKKKIDEAKNIIAGRKNVTAKVGGLKAGLAICYDLRFPGMFSEYAKKGAHILCIPSCFTSKTGQAHWEPLLKARAIENFCYCLAPNQVGQAADGINAYGNSMIINPWGEVLARAGVNEEILYAQISLDEIRKTHTILT